ncbi:hypothetical protein [Algoriphagus yeomjeoni]|uniref:Uncharacterized protein n=1 Tax=Algoriphagus yeomjeoni TaxID=291403 RepID=A0A327PCE9_9BACT|nr:hypothetical protein [Algoriphagus yeomjeoni]RAI89383.1 hypothetical protein LV83_02424 [Algoriphagus yeomjeoni]
MNTAQLKQKTLTDTNQQDLIKGEFSPEDAMEIINHLFSEKINFHGMRSFSNKVRFGEIDQVSEARIVELKQSNVELNEVIKSAKSQGKTLKIESVVTIEII